MKRSNVFLIGLLLAVLVFFVVVVIRADDNKAASKPAPVQITDEVTKQAIQQGYQAVVMANKDFQIALLQARVKYHVNEDWRIDLATLTFTPPEPVIEKPVVTVPTKP